MRVHFGGASGDVYRRDVVFFQNGEAVFERFPAHVFGLSVGAGVNVAVGAGLVAELADVDLKDIKFGRTQVAFRELCGKSRMVDVGAFFAVEYVKLKKRFR
jgi:hypothetical protein